jgi:tetratricopeptide (TPR) repeat protein
MIPMTSRDQIRRDQLTREAEGYLELGMPSHAARALGRLGGMLTVDGRASYLLGESLREQNRYDDAASALELAADLLPDDIHVLLALAWCYKRTDRLSDAIEAIERAIEIEPLEAILHYNLACYWSLARNRSASLRSLAQAFEIDSAYRDMIDDESDFDNLRHDPDFQALTSVIV